MILKASQRGGSAQMAAHLLRTDENEHVEILEIRGFVSDDVPGALKEAYAISRGTRCKQFMFSSSLNPPQDQTPSIDVFEDAISQVEEKTGLTGQPRIILFHEKQGRRHAHAIWSRVDAEKMTAINLPHFKLKMRDVSRSLYLEHGWQMPRGLMNSTERDPRNFTLAEWQEAKRKGGNARDLKSMIQECWAVSDSRAAFAQVLKERGLTLARGERRAHVAITTDGQVFGIARTTGKRIKEIRARLGEADALPSVEQAKAQIAKDMAQAFRRHAQEVKTQKQHDMAELDKRRLAMSETHRAERAKLDTQLEARWLSETKTRSNRLNKGLKGLWQRLTGEHARIQKQNIKEALAATQRDREQRQALIDAQLTTRRVLQAEIVVARSHHAQQFRDVRQDRDRYATAQLNPRQALAPKFERAKTQQPKPRLPSKEEHLQRLREHGTKRGKSRGIER